VVFVGGGGTLWVRESGQKGGDTMGGLMCCVA
jgi:hypothetical protein